MVDYERRRRLQTVSEECESDEDQPHADDDDVRSNSSTLKSRGQRTSGQHGPVLMTESTDSGLESDKNVDSEITPANDSVDRQRRNESLLYHCQVGLHVLGHVCCCCPSVRPFVCHQSPAQI